MLKVPFSAADTRAGGTFITSVSKGTRFRALTCPTNAVASAAAHLAVIGKTPVRLCRAIAVVPNVAMVALAFPTVALAMT